MIDEEKSFQVSKCFAFFMCGFVAGLALFEFLSHFEDDCTKCVICGESIFDNGNVAYIPNDPEWKRCVCQKCWEDMIKQKEKIKEQERTIGK